MTLKKYTAELKRNSKYFDEGDTEKYNKSQVKLREMYKQLLEEQNGND